jgi:hypothetical protein
MMTLKSIISELKNAKSAIALYDAITKLENKYKDKTIFDLDEIIDQEKQLHKIHNGYEFKVTTTNVCPICHEVSCKRSDMLN